MGVGSYATGQEIADKIAAQGVTTTCDPRSANPPCVLVFVEECAYDSFASATGQFQIFALSSGIANADAWATLESLEPAVRAALPVSGYRTVRYQLDTGTPVWAYLWILTQGIEL